MSSGDIAMTFSDNVWLDVLQESITGLQFLKFEAPYSSMALSYKHFSD
jgi:hypothetical protein